MKDAKQFTKDKAHEWKKDKLEKAQSYQDRPGMFTKSVTLSEVAGAGCSANKNTTTEWTTLGGKVYTKKQVTVKFKLPEFFLNKTIEFKVHVDETTVQAMSLMI
jgi:hypothetical protein